ncbi:hypothetical protein U9M48_015846 [Paspalum notatum var. saurae]|uniref:HMA domain-containing protein n=1 Tax=Paspalum notatum var. saurae TaxID=547442 RepID=A0AAQ3WM56_PASNO
MADKISTIVIKVDLECDRCYKKMRRVLCKIQDKLNIKTISFDEKSNAVTISGPFDPDKVCRKLCCEAGRIIKEMDVKGGKEKEGGKAKDGKADAAKPAEKADGGKADKPKDGGKADKKEDKAEKPKEGKADKKEDKAAEKGNKDGGGKVEKKVKFVDEAPPAAEAKPGKAVGMPPGVTKADLGPLLEKMMAARAGPEPPIAAPPAMAPGAAQGVAVPSIWPAPAGSVSVYGYDAPSSYYGAGGYGGCGCGGYSGYCNCGKPAAPGPGGYYGVPVYDNQGWYYGGGGGARQPYYPQQQQQHCCEDPNAGCSVM